MSRKVLGLVAVRAALKTRLKVGAKPWDPVCVYDLAERLGTDVRFVDIGSLEGAYLRISSPTVLVSAHRPSGRQAFTCAHEVGHHVFGHGTRMDELIGGGSISRGRPREEVLADAFAGFLMMPKVAVLRGFSLRRWQPSSCRPQQFYLVARWLGVGYTTLIHHMSLSLGMLTHEDAEKMLKTRVRDIRAGILGTNTTNDVIVVDEHWVGNAVDVEVDDLIVVPSHTVIEGQCVTSAGELCSGHLIRAERPGCGRLRGQGGWASFVRVRRRGFVGRSVFRHLEEAV